MILGLALSVVIGLSLGFFGGGGSILTLPLLVYVFGLPPKAAIASSLLIVAVASTTGAIQHWRAGNVRLTTAGVFGLAGMAGAYAGARVSEFMDGGVLLLLFASIMILTSLAMWRGRRISAEKRAPDPRANFKLALQGFAVGSFTGLVGAGGGFLIVPALALWAGLPLPAAVGTSLVVIVVNSLSGFSGYASHVSIDLGLIGSVSLCAVAGSLVGSRLARRVDPASLARAFASFVFVMGTGILIREAKLVAETAGPALPETLPQLVFVTAVLALGVLAGRASRDARAKKFQFVDFVNGEGI